MLKRRFEILLPLTHNDGRAVDDEKHQQTREELIVRFGATSLSSGITHGVWTHEGTRYEDMSRLLIVDVDDRKKNERFFERWKLQLRARFEQIEIYIISFAIKVH